MMKKTIIVKDTQDALGDVIREVVSNIINGHSTVLDVSQVKNEELLQELQDRFTIKFKKK